MASIFKNNIQPHRPGVCSQFHKQAITPQQAPREMLWSSVQCNFHLNTTHGKSFSLKVTPNHGTAIFPLPQSLLTGVYGITMIISAS